MTNIEKIKWVIDKAEAKGKSEALADIEKIIDNYKWKLNKGKEQIQMADTFSKVRSCNTWHKEHNNTLEAIKAKIKELKK